MSRKSRENKLNENLDILNKSINNLGHGFDYVQSSLEKVLETSNKNSKAQQSMYDELIKQNKALEHRMSLEKSRLNNEDKHRREQELLTKSEAKWNEAKEKWNIKQSKESEKLYNLKKLLEKQDAKSIKLIQQAGDDHLKINKIMQDRLKIQERTQAQINKLKKADAVATAKQNAKSSIIQSLFGTSSEDIKSAQEGTFSTKAHIINTAVDVFKKAVDVFKRAIDEGITKNYNTTEASLNKITASNRMSWSSGSFGFGGNTYTGYSKINNAINDRLWKEGLYNNIANTDVIEATAELTSSKGFGMDETKVSITALEKAYQDTVIKYLVPYLDTANEAYEMLEMTIPRNVKKYSIN